MRIDKVKIDGFKNLNRFEIDLDQSKMHCVLIGQNAAGKSNFIEALVIIFRDLDLNEKKSLTPEFDFKIEYECGGNPIQVVGLRKKDKESKTNRSTVFIEEEKNGFTFYLNGEKITKAEFYRNRKSYLPQHVFSYYSGLSNRLEQHFDTHQRRFLKDLLV